MTDSVGSAAPGRVCRDRALVRGVGRRARPAGAGGGVDRQAVLGGAADENGPLASNAPTLVTVNVAAPAVPLSIGRSYEAADTARSVAADDVDVGLGELLSPRPQPSLATSA